MENEEIQPKKVESTEQIAEEIAEETVGIISSKFNSLEQKIENLETNLKKHLSDFKIDTVEIERMISENHRTIMSEIQKLKEKLESNQTRTS